MPKKVRTIPIKPPAGVKGKTIHRRVGGAKKRVGGFIPAPLIPLLVSAGLPLAAAAGQEAVKGVRYGVKKLRSLLGIGIVRSGSSRAQGGLIRTGAKKPVQKKKLIVRLV